MKMSKIKKVVGILLMTLLLSNCPVIYAQDDGPEPPPDFEDDGPEPPPPAPINDWIPFATAAAMLLAARKYYMLQKAKQ